MTKLRTVFNSFIDILKPILPAFMDVLALILPAFLCALAIILAVTIKSLFHSFFIKRSALNSIGFKTDASKAIIGDVVISTISWMFTRLIILRLAGRALAHALSLGVSPAMQNTIIAVRNNLGLPSNLIASVSLFIVSVVMSSRLRYMEYRYLENLPSTKSLAKAILTSDLKYYAILFPYILIIQYVTLYKLAGGAF
jgi:hypothetical protein